MRFEVIRVPRLPDCPLWITAVVSVSVILGGIVLYVVSPNTSWELRPCLFKRLTGVACPSCGLSRGCRCIMKGRVLKGWLHNPLLFSVLGVWGAVAVLRASTGRKVRMRLTPRAKLVAWAVLIVLLLANWGYLIVCVG